MLRRSDFIAATYALSFVLANFGIAIAARIPMMTTTIRSSISVKPFLLVCILGGPVMWLTDAKADSVVHYSGDSRGLDARDHLGTSRSRRTASVEARASLKRRGKAPLGNTISVCANANYCQKLC